MAKNNPADPKKITALSVGVVVALGVAGWRISEAVSPSTRASAPAAVKPQEPATQTADATAPATSPASGAAEASSTDPGSPPVQVAQSRDGEETLAFTVDPFVQTQIAPRVSSLAPPPTGATRKPSTDLMLPPGGPASGPATPTLPPAATVPVEPPAPPQLVGTILADSPRAVFQTGSGLQSVGRGERIQEWKVVSVQHGAVTLRSGKFSRQLTVNALTAAAQITSTSPTAEALPLEMMAGGSATMVMPVSTLAPVIAAPKSPAVPVPAEPAPLPESTPTTAPLDALPTDPGRDADPVVPAPPQEAR